jgi:hypothetical protein
LQLAEQPNHSASFSSFAPMTHHVGATLCRLQVPCAESFKATTKRAQEQGPLGINLRLTYEGKLPPEDPAGDGYVVKLVGPRSAAHQQLKPGLQDTITLLVLNNGLVHIDLANSDHVSLKTEPNLGQAFTNKRFAVMLKGMDAPADMVWAYRCEQTCRLWLVPLVAVSAITWLAPGANTLATMLLYRWVFRNGATSRWLTTCSTTAKTLLMLTACSDMKESCPCTGKGMSLLCAHCPQVLP